MLNFYFAIFILSFNLYQIYVLLDQDLQSMIQEENMCLYALSNTENINSINNGIFKDPFLSS
jgi:hypothetical protein